MGVAVVLALLGFAQAAAGAHAVRFYDYHHGLGAIGTFANRNHFATLLGMLAPLALAFGAQAQQQRRHARAAAAYGASLVLLLAAALTFSRAGFALTVAAFVIALVIVFAARPGRARWIVPVSLLSVAALAIVAYAGTGLALRFEQDPITDLRWQYLRYGSAVAREFLPWGSGAGSFPWVYAPAEPVTAMASVYADRAHNDLLQIVIECGFPALILLLAFVVMLVTCAARIIPIGRSAQIDDRVITTVAIVAACVPLLHSLVDYPLRAFGVAIVFTLLLALICGANRQEVTRTLEVA
jgi:O-antigen ligase